MKHQTTTDIMAKDEATEPIIKPPRPKSAIKKGNKVTKGNKQKISA